MGSETSQALVCFKYYDHDDFAWYDDFHDDCDHFHEQYDDFHEYCNGFHDDYNDKYEELTSMGRRQAQTALNIIIVISMMILMRGVIEMLKKTDDAIELNSEDR